MIKLPVYVEPHPECWEIYDADNTYLCEADTETNATQITSALNAQQPKCDPWRCGGSKIIKATQEEKESYGELDITCPGCIDCQQPSGDLADVIELIKNARNESVKTDPNWATIQTCLNKAWELVDQAASRISALEGALEDIARGPLQEPSFEKYAVNKAEAALGEKGQE